MDDFCRTCLVFFSESVGKYSLLKNCAITSAPGRLELLKNIMRTFSLSLIPHEDLQVSKVSICKTCVIEMNNMLSFLEKCLQSDATLKQAIVFKQGNNGGIKSINKKTECPFQPKVEIKSQAPQEGNMNKLCLNPDNLPLSIFCKPKKKILKKKKHINFECLECHKKFASALSLTFHKYKHVDYKPHVCAVCNRSFRTFQLIKKHMETEHEDVIHEAFKCGQCFKMFSSKQLLNRHESIRHNTKLFSCNTCKKNFSRISTLKFHENIHSKPGSFNCALCPKKFTNLSQLKDHKKHIHLKSKSFECQCGQIFSRKKKLNLHVKSVHGKEEKPRRYSCTECEKKFLHPRSLKNHINTHLGIKPYLCNACGDSFSTPSNLTNHFHKVHNEKQPVAKMYLCHKCGNSFARASHLKRHTLRKHIPNIEKKHECPVCKKKFLEKSDVNGHIKLHDDTKPFGCEQCSKSFRTSWRLQAHIKRVHLGLRPFECPTCNVKFKTKSHLEKHIRTHTGEKPFPCPYCAYTCAEKSNLKKHINIHLKSV